MMSNYLATFSGRFGDVLWSLPTVKALSQIVGSKLDMAMMPAYKSLIPLLQVQPYIDKAFVIDNWILLHSNFGDQPWNPPANAVAEYERSWHLGYRTHPGINSPEMSLIDFIAWQQGIAFRADKPPVPFLEVPRIEMPGPVIACSFNEQYADVKIKFGTKLQTQVRGVTWLDVGKLPWLTAASAIKQAVCFVGDRSSNHVLAHGVGQKVICFEPHPAKNQSGHLGKVFGCPYGQEYGMSFTVPIDVQVSTAANLINDWKEELVKNSNLVKEQEYVKTTKS